MNRDLSNKFQTLHEIVHAARETLSQNIWDYLRGGTETETTLKRNRMALDAIALRPRVLRDMRKIDATKVILGKKLRLPVCLAPIGSLESFDPKGGVAAMRAATEFGCGLMLSSVSQLSMEEVSNAGDGLKMAMLYKRGDNRFLDNYVSRAIDSGYDAFCLTVDSANYSRRERDIANRFVKPWRTGKGADWQAALSWKDIERYKKKYELPLVLKGIATAEDARLALEHGVDVIYVSNHGGRQLDGSRSPFDQLAEIVDAVGDKLDVICEGGIHRGTHMLKALSLGAKACSGGRLYLYALAAAGQPGVERALELYKSELVRDMKLMGCTKISDLNRNNLRFRR